MSVFSPDVNLDSPLPLPIDGGNPNAVLVTGSVTVLNASIPVTGTFWQAVQPVSGTFWQAVQPVSGTVAVSNPGLTDTQLRASPVPVSGTVAVSNFPATVAVTQSTSPWVVSGTVTANLGTLNGAATAANQALALTSLTTLIANQTNGTQTVSVLNFPADADALAQGSSTAGQLGALEMGAVTTASPVYVTGTTRPLSIDTAGNLRVAMVSAASLSDTVTQITSTGANQVLLAANAARKKAVLFFESGIWDVKFGAGASASSKTYHVSTSNTTIEVPVWAGEIDAICTTSGKLVDVTEMV
jgi:hypothetical protein